MFCHKCGSEMTDDLKFCTNCGTKLIPDAPTNNAQNPESTIQPKTEESYFDGGLLQLIGWKILGYLVIIFSLGICYPWSFTMVYGWEARHTVINGKRLGFDGTAIQLFGKWILWWFLTVITIGIYGLWVPIKLKKWKTKHTFFAAERLSAINFAGERPVAISATGIPIPKDELLNAYITGTVTPNYSDSHYIHYQQAFRKSYESASKINWNWGALLCGGFNLMYRKSYDMGILFAFLTIILSLIPVVGPLISGLISPLFADAAHYRRYKKLLDEAKATYPDDISAQKQFLADKGGVNKRIIAIAIAIVAVAFIIYQLQQ